MSKGTRWMLAVTVGLLASIGVGTSAVHYLQEPYNPGFLDFPTIVALHVIIGGVYLTLAPFQFVKGIRSRHLTYHRWQDNVRIFPRLHGWGTFRKNPNRFPSHGWVLKLLSRTQPAVATTTKRNPMEGEAAMAEDDANNGRAYKQPELASDLKSLGDRLVGTWEMSGEVSGTVTYEWIEGGFFLIQHVDLKQNGQRIKGIEVIGHERPFGAQPSEDIKSRFYDNMGNTLDYVYELVGDTLTIWGGEKGSPAYYRGTFTDDAVTVSGEWVYPGGGGYRSTMTKIKHAGRPDSGKHG